MLRISVEENNTTTALCEDGEKVFMGELVKEKLDGGLPKF